MEFRAKMGMHRHLSGEFSTPTTLFDLRLCIAGKISQQNKLESIAVKGRRVLFFCTLFFFFH